MLAGFAVGSALAQMIPSTAIGTALFAWNSIGPRECACYPRECVDRSEGCVLQTGPEPSSNPFGLDLPYQSQKCVEVKPGECSLQSCETADYKDVHNSTNIYGKIGKIEGGIYNCLASEPRPGKALAQQKILPSGLDNIATNRAALFRSFDIKEKADAPSTSPVE